MVVQSIRMETLDKAIRKAVSEISLNLQYSRDEDRTTFWVNWPCWGDVDPYTAERFGEDLMKVSEIAQVLTELHVTVEYSKSLDGFKSVEDAEKAARRLTEIFEYQNAAAIIVTVGKFLRGEDF